MTYVFQILPDITSVIAKWQSLSKKEKMNDEEKNTPTEGSVTQSDDKNELPGTVTEHTSYDTCQRLQLDCLFFAFPHVEQLVRQLRLSF